MVLYMCVYIYIYVCVYIIWNYVFLKFQTHLTVYTQEVDCRGSSRSSPCLVDQATLSSRFCFSVSAAYLPTVHLKPSGA